MTLLGLPFKDNYDIHELFAHYRIDPLLRSVSEPPKWNLKVALHNLKGPPFKPLGKATL